MLRNNRKNILILCLACGFAMGLSAQVHLSTPYSRFGWGEMQARSSAVTQGMGGTGFAFRSSTVVNCLNPASYTAFDSLSSVLEAAFSYRSHVLTESGARQQGSTANMEYFFLGLPVTAHWSTAFGIQPFSSVNYRFSYQDVLCSRNDIGEGGTYEVFLGNGVELFSRLSVGLQASYLFGTSRRCHELVFENDEYFNMRSEDEYRVHGLLLKAGLQYVQPIGHKEIGFGLTYTPSIPSLIKVDRSLYHLTYQTSGSSDLPIDTLAWNNADKKSRTEHLSNPSEFGLGISFAEAEHFWVGADFSYSTWSVFRLGEEVDSLHDSYRISLGGRFVPNAQGNRYLAKTTYMLGAFYEQHCLQIGGDDFRRMGLDFGLAFPMKKSKTQVGIQGEVGVFGPKSTSGIEERYFRVLLQLQLHEKWYQRRKLD